MTPGTHAQRVSKKTIITEPHPLSMTARGGNIIANITRNRLIVLYFIFYKTNQIYASWDGLIDR